MPTYQYACTACDERLEAVQSFTDAALTECPACGGRLRKVYGAVGVVFKGSGFYKTDSRKGEGAPKADGAGDKTGDKAGAAAGGDKPSGGNGATPAKAGSGAKESSGSSNGSGGGSGGGSGPGSGSGSSPGTGSGSAAKASA